MAITVPALTVTMTDAEYTLLNDGVAAPTVNQQATFGRIGGLTAASAAGTTTITIPAGTAFIRERHTLIRRIHRLKLGGTTITIN